jgi:hypothetical protein
MANSNGWGDGSVNNNIGWGQGANNNIGWGKSHLNSWSGATDIDGGNPPVNSVAPALSGTAQEGQTLTCSTGTWSGSPTYTYQWKRDGNNITSATNSTYTLVTADVGQSIKCTVTATNFIGSANADSNTVIPTALANLLLDTYTGAAVAYSLRQLRTAYTGAAIRVRRSSDNAEQDINFVGGDLDTSSLLSFVGAGNGFITTWYDQSGNANNSTQATATSQAQIVSSGAVITDPNTSKITTTWTDDRYDLTTGISPNTRYLSLNVVNRTATSNDFYSLGTATFGGGVNSQSPFVWFATTGNINSYMPTALTHGTNNTTGAFIVTSEKNASNLKTIYVDGVALATTATEAPSAGNNFIYFGRSGNNFITGQLSEYIYWNSEQSANRTGIETNVNTYWNAY